jgi:hypothetical protein
VKLTVEWPSISLMTLGGCLAARSIVAATCLSPCRVTGGSPARAARVSKRTEIHAGRRAVPVLAGEHTGAEQPQQARSTSAGGSYADVVPLDQAWLWRGLMPAGEVTVEPVRFTVTVKAGELAAAVRNVSPFAGTDDTLPVTGQTKRSLRPVRFECGPVTGVIMQIRLDN